MTTTNYFFRDGKAAVMAGAATLFAALAMSLTGCGGYVDGPGGTVAVASPAIAEQDDYVYYPSYETYYSGSGHQYSYREGGAWVSRPAPQGVAVEALRASPSVKMDFHDAPAITTRRWRGNIRKTGSRPRQINTATTVKITNLPSPRVG